MLNSTNPQAPSAILWRQLWGLAILQLAVGWGWQIYSAAQPIILTEFNLMAVAGLLTLVPGLLGLTLDPFMGRLADQIQRRVGSRLPMLNVGVILTSLIFVAVALSLQTDWLYLIRWIIPLMMVAWVTTMKIFQNPSISLIKGYAIPRELPHAMAILTIGASLVSATRPFSYALVAQLGPSLSFFLGGLILGLAMTVMRWLTPKTTEAAKDELIKPAPPVVLGQIFVIGACIQMAIDTSLAVVPSTLLSYLPNVQIGVMGSLLALVSGLSAIPLSQWIKQKDSEYAIQWGLVSVLGIIGLAGLGLTPLTTWLLVGFLGVILALLYNVGVPFALNYLPAYQSSWGIGLFFGGGGAVKLGLALFGLLYGSITLPLAGALSGGAFMVAWLCLRRLITAKIK